MPTIDMLSSALPARCVLLQLAQVADEAACFDYMFGAAIPFAATAPGRIKLKLLTLCRWRGSTPEGIEAVVSRAAVKTVVAGEDPVTRVTLRHASMAVLTAFVDKCVEQTEADVRAECTSHAGPRKFMLDGGFWEAIGPLAPRPLSTVFFPAGCEGLLPACEAFVNPEVKRRYDDHGIPYKLNVMLTGPPGSGKTSMISAMATHLGSDVFILNLGLDIDDNSLAHCLKAARDVTKPPPIIVLEDIESLFCDDRKLHDSHRNRVTASGLLNALDGLPRTEGSILFLTANSTDCLDEAFTRSARIDHRFVAGPLEAQQARAMLRRFVPEAADDPDLAASVERRFVGRAASDLNAALFRCRTAEDVRREVSGTRADSASASAHSSRMYT